MGEAKNLKRVNKELALTLCAMLSALCGFLFFLTPDPCLDRCRRLFNFVSIRIGYMWGSNPQRRFGYEYSPNKKNEKAGLDDSIRYGTTWRRIL